MPALSRTRLAMAVALLRDGQLIGYPTEAVFGLGCDPCNPGALEDLVRLKGRDRSKGFILIASDVGQLRGFLGTLDETSMKRVLASWPGPTTWVVPAAARTHRLLSGGRATIAVRVTDHPVARALCRRFGGALVSTSANRSGDEPARSARTVRRRFAGRVALVLDGPLGTRRKPSTIREARTGRVLRAGDGDVGS